MRPVTVQVGPLATASANNICLSQTPSSAFTINGALATGGVATLDVARRVLFTPVGNEASNTFTITGTNASGLAQTEILTGANAVSFYSNLDFKTVSAISCSAAASGAITVGTNTIASSAWVRFDEFALSQVAIQCTATGSVTYTVQQTLQDPNSATNPVAPYSVAWINSSDTAAVNASGSIQTSYQYAPIFARVTLSNGTGSVSGTFTQFGVAPY